MGLILIHCAVLFLFLFFSTSNAEQISLKLTEGTLLLGTRDHIDHSQRTYFSFRGIRYASPPLGTHRWKDSELLDFESGTVSATNYGSQCVQWAENLNKSIGEEDCLFLNVFSPSIPRTSGTRPGFSQDYGASRSLLPVMVYIHGGGFATGSGDQFGPKRFMKHEVILVTFNYRLGVFGFLSKGDSELPGNYGLMDQNTALLWVKKNIRDFGGNPNRITIFGSSAGGSSVHLHTLSRLSIDHAAGQPLFHQAIIQSGNALCDWSLNTRPWDYAETFANLVECPTGDSAALVECLQEKKPSTLIEIQQTLTEFSVLPIKLGPVVDGHSREYPFLDANPSELMNAGAFLQVPILTGVTNGEGLLILTDFLLNLNESHFGDEEFWKNDIIPQFLRLTASAEKQDGQDIVTRALYNQYFEGVNLNDSKIAVSKLNEMIGDGMFYGCQRNFLEKLNRGSSMPVYNYVFTHKTPNSPNALTGKIRGLRRKNPEFWNEIDDLFANNVAHGEELFYLFSPLSLGPGQAAQQLSAGDERVAEAVTRFWVNFASRGNPETESFPGYQEWSAIDESHMNYYNLSSGPAPMGQDYRKGESEFWDKTLPFVQDLGEKIDEMEKYHVLFWVFVGISIFLLIVVLSLAIALYKQRRSV